jgi:hypothetical protein
VVSVVVPLRKVMHRRVAMMILTTIFRSEYCQRHKKARPLPGFFMSGIFVPAV